MQTVSTQFGLELENRVRLEIVRLHDELGAGQAVKDYAQYQNYVGQLNALGRVLNDFCPEVTKIINER